MATADRGPGTAEHGRPATGALAWVDVRSVRTPRWSRPDGVAGMSYALHSLGRAVRNGDRVCPATSSLVAVAFGPEAATVPLRVLGDRLARAVGPGPVPGHRGTGLSTAVGLVGTADTGVTGASQRALAMAGASRAVLVHEVEAGRRVAAAVTVDAPVVVGGPDRRADGPARSLRRRTVRRYEGTTADGIVMLRPAGRGPSGRAATHPDRPLRPGRRPDGR